VVKRKSPRATRSVALATEQVDNSILVIRGNKVLLDEQLAAFDGVETKRLVEAVKRNVGRFPEDFMFQLNREEWVALRSQFATLNLRPKDMTARLRSQTVSSKTGRGQHRKYPPYAFTEQGVAMLSSVLRSPRAIVVNIQIMRAFVRIRQLLSAHKGLAERLEKLERQMRERGATVDQEFRHVFSLLERLFAPPSPARRPIGFHAIH
jgi:hypothetical protein